MAAALRGSDGLRLVSTIAGTVFRQWRERLRPRLAAAGEKGGSILARLEAPDLVPFLIAAADRAERCARALWRGLRWLAPRRGIGLAGALIWRGGAALAGLGLTAALVTGLSAKDEEPVQLASLAAASVPRDTTRPLIRAGSLGAADWSAIPRPIAMFNLGSPELGRAAPAYEARRTSDGRREDILAFAGFAEAGPHLVLRLRTGPLDPPGARPFAVDLAREAALRALSVARSSTPAPVPTRFGPLETADVVLDDGGVNRSCLAFRSATGEAGFAMSGWWCASAKPSDRRQLACLIDRLDLANGGGGEDLRLAFARSELRRDPACAPPHLATAGRKASWLDTDGTVPTLRLKTAAAEPAKAAPVRARPARRKR